MYITPSQPQTGQYNVVWNYSPNSPACFDISAGTLTNISGNAGALTYDAVSKKLHYDGSTKGVSVFELLFTEGLSSQQYRTAITINSLNCNPSTSISTTESSMNLTRKLGKISRNVVPTVTQDGTCPLTYTVVSSWPASVAFYDSGYIKFDFTGIDDPSSSYLGSSTHTLKIEESTKPGVTPIEIPINLKLLHRCDMGLLTYKS